MKPQQSRFFGRGIFASVAASLAGLVGINPRVREIQPEYVPSPAMKSRYGSDTPPKPKRRPRGNLHEVKARRYEAMNSRAQKRWKRFCCHVTPFEHLHAAARLRSMAQEVAMAS